MPSNRETSTVELSDINNYIKSSYIGNEQSRVESTEPSRTEAWETSFREITITEILYERRDRTLLAK